MKPILHLILALLAGCASAANLYPIQLNGQVLTDYAVPAGWTDPYSANLVLRYGELTNTIGWVDDVQGITATNAGSSTSILVMTNAPFGKIGKCFRFGGSSTDNRYFELPTNATPKVAGTVMFWANSSTRSYGPMAVYSTETLDGNHTFDAWVGRNINLGSGYPSCWAYDNGGYQFQLLSDTEVGDVGGAANGTQAWTHVAITWTNTTGATMYQNGTNVARDATANLTTTNMQWCGIGFSKGWGSHFQGYLADVRFYNIPLTSNQVNIVFSNSWGWR